MPVGALAVRELDLDDLLHTLLAELHRNPDEQAVDSVLTVAVGRTWQHALLIEQHRFQYEGKNYPVTISVGVSTTSGDENMTPHELIRQADEKLYLAKNDGRNCVRA